ncbi:CHRD domain-containing protein [Oxalobacteraceae bacterium CAVE-383]|nr:CHRD domain-containing protein [Oxalobacteraceae bacterium CAVE-383]
MEMKDNKTLTLTGAQEVPPVTTTASAVSTVAIAADHTVSGTITTTGIAPTMAHIHMAPAPGANGPVIVPFKKTADNVFSAPDNTKLTDEQYAALKAGRLYVNVHSAAHPAGEIRANLPAN